MFRSAIAGALLSGLCVWAPDAVAADPEAGKAVVEMWCVSCHLGSGGRVTQDGAPPITAIARVMQPDTDMLQRVLADPHPPMPEVSLTRRQIEDVVAYLATLRAAN